MTEPNRLPEDESSGPYSQGVRPADADKARRDTLPGTGLLPGRLDLHDPTGEAILLVVYDYGAGGLWESIFSSDRASFLERYPELKVVEQPMVSMIKGSEGFEDAKRRRYRSGEDPWGLTKMIVDTRP